MNLKRQVWRFNSQAFCSRVPSDLLHEHDEVSGSKVAIYFPSPLPIRDEIHPFNSLTVPSDKVFNMRALLTILGVHGAPLQPLAPRISVVCVCGGLSSVPSISVFQDPPGSVWRRNFNRHHKFHKRDFQRVKFWTDLSFHLLFQTQEETEEKTLNTQNFFLTVFSVRPEKLQCTVESRVKIPF